MDNENHMENSSPGKGEEIFLRKSGDFIQKPTDSTRHLRCDQQSACLRCGQTSGGILTLYLEELSGFLYFRIGFGHIHLLGFGRVNLSLNFLYQEQDAFQLTPFSVDLVFVFLVDLVPSLCRQIKVVLNKIDFQIQKRINA